MQESACHPDARAFRRRRTYAHAETLDAASKVAGPSRRNAAADDKETASLEHNNRKRWTP